MSSLQQVLLVAWSLLVGFLIIGLLLRHRRKTPGPSRVKAHVKTVNDSLDQPSAQSGTPKIQVLFFRGIPSHDDWSDIHLTTWCNKDGCLWPQTWLMEKFPGIHVFFVKYKAALVNEHMHMNNVGENLLSDLLQANIGQVPGCSIVMVGHCIGGLVIKELCSKAHKVLHLTTKSSDRANKLRAFLKSVKGVFFYSTPHHGIRDIGRASHLQRSPLLKFLETLSRDAAVLNENFDQLSKIYSKWKIEGVGESLPVEYGVFHNILVVEEPSARGGLQIFSTLNENHFSVCKPNSQISGGYYHLINLLDTISEEQIKAQAEAEEENHPQNLQRLPNSFVGMGNVLQERISRLENVRIMGLTGMGGLGKTTLAKAIFNEVGHKYEYRCFIPEVKLISGGIEDVKTKVWKQVHRNGKQVGKGDWSKLRGKDIIVVFDDISSDRDIGLLLDIAHASSKQSRFLATSLEKSIFDRLDGASFDIDELSGLDDNNARQLFMNYAFPNKEDPPVELESLMTNIVGKCEGLPLALEVLGQYLKRKTKEEAWRQTLASLDEAENIRDLNDRLWSKLMPSIDGVEESELQMFLDATTFFYDEWWTLREALAAWGAAYGVKERLLWETLVDRSLVYDVEDDKQIKIHEQLRSLGRKLANKSEKGRVLKGSTVAKSLLLSTNELDKKDMHALKLRDLEYEDIFEVRSIAAEANLEENIVVDGRLNLSALGIQKLEKLKYLDVVGVGPIRCPRSLVALRASGLQIPNLARLKRLVVLKVDVVDLASLANSIGQLSALRILTFFNCEGEAIPEEIGNLSSLEVLDIGWCKDVKTLPESLGKLSKLKIMILRDGEWETLPECFGQLSSLKYLEISGCSELESLPESFGHLPALANLTIGRCYGLKYLPKSFGHLPALANLTIESCFRLKSLPDSFGHLPALANLTINRCWELESLPETFGDLSALRRLEFYSCLELRSVPESMGNLPILSHLKLEECDGLHCLPESLGRLAKLEHLEINDCEEVESLPDSLAQLVTLRHLVINAVWSLKVVPDWIQHLPSLHTLELGVLPCVKELPPCLGETGVGRVALSRKAFRREDRLLSLTEDTIVREPRKLVDDIHSRVMRKVELSDYEGSLAILEVCSLGIPSLDGFLLTEKGVVKRKKRDLDGALHDLTAAIECYSMVEDGHHHTYDCWRHRGYVKFLMGDTDGAENGGTMALKCRANIFSDEIYSEKSLGDELVEYLHFRLDGWPEIADKHHELMLTFHSDVMEKVKVSNFQGAISS